MTTGSLARVAVALAATAAAGAACRVVGDRLPDGSPLPDATFPDAPPGDAPADARRDDAADGAPADAAGEGPPPDPTCLACDLLAQDCPNRQACYPQDLTLSGAACCRFPGSAGPLSPCALNEECDVRAICVFLDEVGANACAELCDPTASATGCQLGSPCRALANYRAGFCVP